MDPPTTPLFLLYDVKAIERKRDREKNCAVRELYEMYGEGQHGGEIVMAVLDGGARGSVPAIHNPR